MTWQLAGLGSDEASSLRQAYLEGLRQLCPANVARIHCDEGRASLLQRHLNPISSDKCEVFDGLHMAGKDAFYQASMTAQKDLGLPQSRHACHRFGGALCQVMCELCSCHMPLEEL